MQTRLINSHIIPFLSIISHKWIATYHYLLDIYVNDDIVALCLTVNQIN